MTKFSDLKLDPKVLQAIAEAGYETPTPIQAGAIPPALEGRDVLGIAQTGTGKTASFTLPMITLLGRGRARARMPRSLVLCPTRELAAQVAENFDIYAKHTRLTKALLIGGVSFGEQDKLIDRGVDVLIATPGRLLDHFERGKLLLTGVQVMVVDEADRMLDMGFIPDIERIFQLTPFTRQTLFFSATMAPEIERITNTFLHSPERIEVARQATTSETITQKLVELTPTRKDQTAKQKRELLRALIDAEGEALNNAIIFCNRKTDVDIVAKSLKAHGYDAAPIHGDLDQRVRMATLDGFRDGTLRFLIASDVAARGLDIPAVSHVFNFDLPSHAEDYVHRIGRTGRAGRLGTAISISTPMDEKYLSAIENLVKQTLPRAEFPEGFEFSKAAQTAPRERNDREKRGNGRDRRRGGRRSEAEAAPEAVEEVVVEAVREERQPERREERQDDRRAEQQEARSDDRRNAPRADRERNGDRNDRNSDRRHRDRDRGPAVVGLGDHVPDFLNTSFAEAIAVTDARIAASAARAAEQPAKEEQAETSPEPVQAEAPRTRGRRGRGAKATKTEAAQVEATEVAATEPTADVAEVVVEPSVEVAEPAPQSEEAPKPRRTRTRRKVATEAVEAEAADAATAEPAADTEAAEEKSAKPRRARAPRKPRVKADATEGAEAPAEAPAVEPAAPAPDHA